MSALVWNCHGIGGTATVRTLADLVRGSHPLVVGLLETKAGKVRMDRVQKEIGFCNGFVVEVEGAREGWLCGGKQRLTYQYGAILNSILRRWWRGAPHLDSLSFTDTQCPIKGRRHGIFSDG
ncbi:hypothetical protein QQ045_005732 [Rhodiola kirilowii]